jgi:dienelactone hydrolase
MNTWLLLFLPLWILLGCRAHADNPVAAYKTLWLDSSRGREIPAKIYHPASDAKGPFPVILFSHGLGGSCDGYHYLGEYWAAHGYVCIHLQHPGSDSALLGSSRPLVVARRMREALLDPDNSINRPLDMRFAIDQIERLAHDPEFALHDKLDLGSIGIAGHSYGAYTVLAVAGQRVAGSPAKPDSRVKAAIAMSSQAPRIGDINTAYDAVSIPIFHLTGTADSTSRIGLHGNDDGVGDATSADRRVAFDHTTHAPAYLLIFNGGDHMLFSGQRRRGADVNDAVFHAFIQKSTLAFWDAMLKNDREARRWFVEGGLTKDLGNLGIFEQKAPTPATASP